LRLLYETSWLELEYYCGCVGKNSCTLSLLSHDAAVNDEQKKDLLWKFSEGCNFMVEKNEPKLYIVSRCIADEVVIPKDLLEMVGI
jgi:hypothetical protein